MPTNIFEYVTQETNNYKALPVALDESQWDWNMWEHLRRSFLVKHSRFYMGKNDGSRPFKNIVRPILNVAYRSEGFDVKDIEPFVDDVKKFYKSFLVRKYHPKWARKHDIDTFIDDLVESYVDYGLVLIKRVKSVAPEVVPLQTLAFCDQTNVLGGPLGIRHEYSISEMLDMKGKWYDDEIDMCIAMSRAEKAMAPKDGKKTKTPGKYIEVFEVHGMFPESWLKDDGDPDRYTPQMHIITYYTDQQGKRQGICLYKGPEKGGMASVFKALKRDPIFGRACGYGGVEELFEPQTWANYSEIQLKKLLDKAGLLILQTADETLAKRHKVSDAEKGEIFTHAEGKPLSQVSITPQNKVMFDEAFDRWERNARTIGSADEAQLGESPSSGTPFRLQALVVQEGRGLHDYRRGKIANFLGEIYRDWVLKDLVAEINAGQRFVDDLSVEELKEIADVLVTKEANKRIKRLILSGKQPTRQEMDAFKETVRQNFLKGGTKRFIEALKGELEDLPVDVEMNIAGKQKDLAERADKLTNVFRAVIANPQILQTPGMGQLFNEILEASGFSPISYSSLTKPAAQETTAGPEATDTAIPSPVAAAPSADAALVPNP